MGRFHRALLPIALVSTAALSAPTTSEVVKASDGGDVHVYDYRPATAIESLPILMFHQGDSDARGELGPIAEQLASEGYRVLTADLRAGGSKLGGHNATAAAYANKVDMCGSYADVLAALDYALRATDKRMILLGSSYSAALVVKAAAERPADVAGFISMSPASGPPMKGCEPEEWLAKAQPPGVAFRPKREIEAAAWIKEQAETWHDAGIPVRVFDVPSHGASMLVPSRAGPDSAKVLSAVRKFMGALQRDEAVAIQSAEWRLRGDFRTGLREGRRPAVLLLNKANGDRKAYERLAAELARRGISSLRLDLRGHGESINAGKFIPFDEANNSKIFVNEDVDVVSALAWLRSRPDVDSDRIGVVGASYSGELAAQAARREGKFARAYALLSPGSLSEESVKGMDPSGARWLFIRAARERAPSLPLAAAQIEAVSRSGSVRVLDSDKHATDLLAEPLALAPSLADWLHDALDGSNGGQTALAH